MMLAVALLLAFPFSSLAAKTLLVTFDHDQPVADHSDWGSVAPLSFSGFRLTDPGQGCPSNPDGRALDAGATGDTEQGALVFEIPSDADLRQGTVEFWFRPSWGSGERGLYTLFHIKLRGGPWNSIWLGYHGTIGPDTEAFGANIMDGLDHPAYLCDAKPLNWKPEEWHHIAFTWTDQTEWVFVDGKLIAQYVTDIPFISHPTEGEISIGGPFRAKAPTAGGFIDELRFCNVPLYTPDDPPDPFRRVGTDLGLGLASLSRGAVATADGTAAPQQMDQDVPVLHDGVYGVTAPVGHAGQGEVMVHLAEEAEVVAFEWSRDGVPYDGPEGRGWAHALPWPLDFTIATSLDGSTWEPAVEATDFHITPSFLETHTALVFRHDFSPRRCRAVRMRITRGPRNNPTMLMDEVAVYDAKGINLALLPRTRVASALVMSTRHFAPDFAIDGRWGEQSCWRSATPGQGTLTVELPDPTKITRVVYSRSREGLHKDGTPTDGEVQVSPDGVVWQTVGAITGDDPRPRVVEFEPLPTRYVRLIVTATNDGKEPTIDDLRVF